MNLVVTHWSANAVVVTACAAVVVVHLLGMRAATAGAGRQQDAKRTGRRTEAVAFYSGLFVVLLALVSPVGYWAQHYIWVRSLQDLLLAVVAPGLIVLGAPWQVLAAGVRRGPGTGRSPGAARAARGDRPATGGRPAAGAWGAGPWAARPRTWLSWPVGMVVAFNVAWWGWHAPVLYDAAMRWPIVYGAEVVTYLGLGTAFWLQLIGSGSLRPRLAPLHRVLLIAATIVSDTVLAMGLAFSQSLVYPGYLGVPQGRAGVVGDQQIGGAILWTLIVPPLMITAVALLIRWLKNEESEALTAGLGRLLDPPTSAWPSRPGLK